MPKVRSNQTLEPTICPAAELRTLSALHNSTSGQIAAQLISYGFKPYRNFDSYGPIVMTGARRFFSKQPSCKEVLRLDISGAIPQPNWPAWFSSLVLPTQRFGGGILLRGVNL